MGWGHAPAAGVDADTVVAANTGHNYAPLASVVLVLLCVLLDVLLQCAQLPQG